MVDFIKIGEKRYTNNICDVCHKQYLQHSINYYRNVKHKRKNCCSKECQNNSKKTQITGNCGFCGLDISRIPSQYKSKLIFCNHSCSAKYSNQNRKIGIRRSKAEIYLIELIKTNFPDTIVVENDRTICHGYEIDISLPEIKLAIEWNGVVHYKPIYGIDKLTKIKLADQAKKQILKQKEWLLVTIKDKSKKYLKSHIENVYSVIKLLIQKRTTRK